MALFNKIGKVGNTIYTSTARFTDEVVDGARQLEIKRIPHRVKLSEVENNLGVIAKVAESSLVSRLHGLLRLEDNTAKAGTVTARQIGMMYGAHREAIRRGQQALENEYQAWIAKLSSVGNEYINNPGELAQIQARMKAIRREQSSLQSQQIQSYLSEGLAYGKRFLQHTFAEGTTMDRVKKAATYGGIYMGANIIGRGLTGGGVTYNSDGERDIAGIPLI